MPIQKNIPKVKQSSLSIPPQLEKRKSNYEDASYTYTFSKKEDNYIKYNTLRNKRKDKELIDVVKIYWLQDRETSDEYLVYYQSSKVLDFNNNLVPCPMPECIGVVDMPKTNVIKNESDEPTDIVLTEMQNEYTEPYSKDKVLELFKKSRSSNNIACYVGFTKNPKVAANDFIENKKLIRNQEAFLSKEFDDLITLPDNLNMKRTWKNNKDNSLKKLKENRIIKMKDVTQPKDIEKRVKDNGQLWQDDTNILSEQIKTEQENAAKLKEQENENGTESESESEGKGNKSENKNSDNKNSDSLKETENKLRATKN